MALAFRNGARRRLWDKFFAGAGQAPDLAAKKVCGAESLSAGARPCGAGDACDSARHARNWAGAGKRVTGKTLDIAVAGAGPAGLAAALLLARDGHRVTLFERFEEAAPVGSGLILQPTGMAVLHALGLLPHILALGRRIDRLHGIDARTGRTVLDVRYGAGPRGRFGLAVHRAALWGVLHRAAIGEGLAIRTGCEAAGLDRSASGVALMGEGGRRLGRFDLAVDATGRNSKLRQAAWKPSAPKPLAYGALWASLPWVERGFDATALLQRYSRASVMIGVLPIGRAESNGPELAAFFWSLKPNEWDALRARGLDAWKAAVLSLWPDCAAYCAAIEDWDRLTLARYGHHTLSPPAGPRLAVIGDAAHSTSPQLGQGANMALLDAAALAAALRDHADLTEALGAYVRARRWHVKLFQALSAVFTPFYQSDSRALPIIRDRLVASIARVPPAPAFLAALVSGMLLDPLGRVGLTEPAWEHLLRDNPPARHPLQPEAPAGDAAA